MEARQRIWGCVQRTYALFKRFKVLDSVVDDDLERFVRVAGAVDPVPDTREEDRPLRPPITCIRTVRAYMKGTDEQHAYQSELLGRQDACKFCFGKTLNAAAQVNAVS